MKTAAATAAALTPKDVALKLGMSRESVLRALDMKLLAGEKVDGRWRIRWADVRVWRKNTEAKANG